MKRGIVALLAVLMAIPAALYVIPAVQAQGTYSAWLKIVTTSWNGVPCVAGGTPACPDATTTGFADRYNLTGQWYWVEVYQERGAPFNDAIFYPRKFDINATGFVRIEWPDTWSNVTVVVKAKSYDGTEVGAGSLYSGIIVYMMVINASTRYIQSKIGQGHWRTNATVLMDGTVRAVWLPWTSTYGPSLLSNTGGRAGPVDFVAMSPANFSTAFGTQSEYVIGSTRYARNAWVANASVVFTPFHVHTWYSTKDNLSYAQVKIYEMNITSGAASLIRAFVTKGDGSGNSLYDPRTTNEMYPVYGTRYKTNELVPIPLAAVNTLSASAGYRLPFRNQTTGPDLRAHLNATVRVWWETVLVNTTFFAGWNSSTSYPGLGDVMPDAVPTMRYRPGGSYVGRAAPLLQALQLSYNFSTSPYKRAGFDEGLYIFLNSTVFYWRCGVRDDDLMVNGTVYHPDNFGWGFRTFNSSLFLATCKFNLRDKDGNAYYLQNQVGTTEEPFAADSNGDGIRDDGFALTSDPHSWPGYQLNFTKYLRVPNATVWAGLRTKFAGIKVFAEGRFARDEVYTSRYYTGTVDLTTNDPTKVAVNDYLKTRSISDDPGPYNGLRIEVQYSGGFMDSYGGASQTVGVFFLRNPYLVVLKNMSGPPSFGGWVNPRKNPDSYPEIASVDPMLVRLGTSDGGGPILGLVGNNTVRISPGPRYDPIFGPRTFNFTGKLLLVANVSDIVITVRDNEGNVLNPSDVRIWLIRETGSPVELKAYRLVSPTPIDGKYAYEQVGPVSWPFLWRLNISTSLLGTTPPVYVWVAFQVPEDLMYGIRVQYAGVTVYENSGEINKLVRTVFVDKTINPIITTTTTTTVFTTTPATITVTIFNTRYTTITFYDIRTITLTYSTTFTKTETITTHTISTQFATSLKVLNLTRTAYDIHVTTVTERILVTAISIQTISLTQLKTHISSTTETILTTITLTERFAEPVSTIVIPVLLGLIVVLLGVSVLRGWRTYRLK
ncbi:MAG: hypothetical protein QW263_02770 [Nitrososphaerota archaeon]